MKIVLVGNLPEDRQESMQRFTQMMERGLLGRGHEVTVASPKVRFGGLLGAYRYSGLRKYLGYLDKYLLFPRQLRRSLQESGADIVHITDHANACYAGLWPERSLVTCHDLLQIRASLGELPQQKLGRAGKQYQAWIRKHIAQTRHCACVSEKTAQDLSRLTGMTPERLRVIPNALNATFTKCPEAEAVRRIEQWSGRQEPWVQHDGFVLNVGGGQWYKNRPGLLRLHAQLEKRLGRVHPLVMVGKALSPADLSLATSLGIAPRIHSLQGVPHPVLEALYSLAAALLFPSLEEGFGWPNAEAQACGCPVITSKRSPMQEVAGPHALLIDPVDPHTAAQEIAARWEERRSLAKAALPLAKRWEPETMFSAYESYYGDILKGSS